MRQIFVAAVLAVIATAGTASAQGFDYKPIDTSKLVVQPTDTATNIFTRTSRYISRVVAGTIEENGYVKSINNLFGRRASSPMTTQPGYSQLPSPNMYPSTRYKNSFAPAMPTYQTFGKTPGTR